MEVATVLMLLITSATSITALPPLTLSATSHGQPQAFRVAPSQLLKAFGLSEPGVRRWHTEPPQYMLDLYNQVADSNGLTRLPGPYGSSIIRAFSEKGTVRDQDSIFSFILNGLGRGEEVLEVEFHVYHSRLSKAQRHLLEDNIYQLEVYWVGGSERQVVVKQHIAAHSSGWRVFRVGRGVVGPSGGLEEGRRLVTLEVTASSPSGRRLPLALHHEARGSRQPLLVLFNSLATNTTLNTTQNFAEARGYSSPSTNRVRRSVVDNPTVETPVSTTPTPPLLPSGCERRDMFVDFEVIGWSSWIVYPKSYNAYQCVGECQFPLGQNLNPTNHATVQSIMNNTGHSPVVLRPCCVPAVYGNLSLLYYDSDENVVLKQYDQMVATQCGCH